MLLQHLAQGFAKDTHAAAVNDAHARESGKEGAVNEFFDFAGGLVDGLSDHVDFARDVRPFALELDRYPASTSGLHRSVGGASAGEYFSDVVARNLHLHGAHLDFKVGVVDFADDSRRASCRFQLDCVALENMFYDLRLRVWIALIGSGGVGNDGSIELLTEFAAQLGDAALGVFGKLLRSSSILNGTDGLAGMILKIAKHAVELLLHVPDFRLLFLFSFGSQALFFPLDILFALAQARAFCFGFAQFGVKFVE